MELHTSLSKVQQYNLSLAEYYGKLKTVWDKLQVLDGHLSCSCGAIASCTCELLKKVLDAEESKKADSVNENNSYASWIIDT